VCIITYQPDTKYNHSPNPATKQHARNSEHSTKYSHTSYTYPDKFTRDNVVAPFYNLLFSFSHCRRGQG